MPNLGTQRIGMVCHLMLVFARWLVGWFRDRLYKTSLGGKKRENVEIY